jgi:hypothetical protein
MRYNVSTRNLPALGSSVWLNTIVGCGPTEADARRSDLYVRSGPFQLDIAQHLAPEPSQQFGIRRGL